MSQCSVARRQISVVTRNALCISFYLYLLSPHYPPPQEFHFYPIWGNLPRFADHWFRPKTCVWVQILTETAKSNILNNSINRDMGPKLLIKHPALFSARKFTAVLTKSPSFIPPLRHMNRVYAPRCFLNIHFNLLETEFCFIILAHPVRKMWRRQKRK
jgi:hypothetical protein